MLYKKEYPCVSLYLLFLNLDCIDGVIRHYLTLCHCVEPSTPWETKKGGVKYKKAPPAYGSMSFTGIPRSSPVS